MRPVAIVASATTDLRDPDPHATTPEMAFQVAHAAVSASGIDRRAIDLTVSASSDMLEGRPFNFVKGLEALGAWPAVAEKHLEMDGAWAAWHAWMAIQAGEADSALVVAWSKTSETSLHHALNRRLDPFTLAPLGLDDVSCAALQADAWLTRTGRAPGALDTYARDGGDEPVASPLRTRHLPHTTDGACAIVLAASPSGTQRPVWIRGADHRTECGSPARRDLSRATTAAPAGERAAAQAGFPPAETDTAELGARYAHQVPMLIEALRIDEGATAVNPSGGPIAADPIMATGLVRLAETAARLDRRGLAHMATGAAMQQHIVFLLESDA